MRGLSVLFPLMFGCALHAQDPRLFSKGAAEPDTPVVEGPGSVTLHEPERISALMELYTATRQPLKGYRVQVFLGDRSKAEETRRLFMTRHTETPAYLSYLAPNFRVRVGDLRTRLEAEKLRDVLREEYPGLYVVPDDIEPPRPVSEASGAAKP
jgi:hypothetical protein